MTEASERRKERTAPSGRTQFFHLLDGALNVALALTVVIASAAIFAQVVLRYVFNRPLAWGDEFAVLVFAWMVFIGAAVVQRTDSHISMDTFARLLPARARAVLDGIRFAAMGLVLVLLFVQGWVLAARFGAVRYPAMGISRGFLYAALPVCTPLMGLYLVRNLLARRRLRPGQSERA